MRSTRCSAAFLALALASGLVGRASADEPAPGSPPVQPAPDPAPKPAEEEGPDTTRGYVGYTPTIVQMLLAEDREALGVTREDGFVITAVIPRTPAEKAGLKRGDVLLKLNGEDLPDTKGLDVKDEAKRKKFEKDAWVERVKKVKPGDVVVLLVERGGKRIELKATAIPWDAYSALVELAKEDEMSIPVPDPAGAGPPAATTVDFETVPEGDVKPDGFVVMSGTFEVYAEKEKPANHVLKQYGSGAPRTVCLATGKGRAFADGVAKVRLQCLGGMEGVGGGIVVRAKDRKNYLVVRADGVAKNLRVIAIRDAQESVLASVDLASPKLKTWLSLEVTFQGATLKAVLDGKTTVEATDDAPGSGWCGLSTEADAETQFDDFEVKPAAGAGK